MNSVTQQAIVLALKNWSFFKEQIGLVVKERAWLFEKIKEIEAVKPYPSDANFILFKVNKDGLTSAKLTKRIENRNILVKDRGHLPLLDNCIRVTVGTRKMNESFVLALKQSIEE